MSHAASVSRAVDAPPSRAWRAVTTGELAAWFWPPRFATTAAIDPRVGGGLRIHDVGQIQDRVRNPKAPQLASMTWHGSSIPQVAEPFTRDGHQYLLEVDEFVDLFSFDGLLDLKNAPVGAARIINVDDPRNPFLVSDIRLAVHQPENHAGEQYQDPGAANPLQGYAATTARCRRGTNRTTSMRSGSERWRRRGAIGLGPSSNPSMSD